MACKICGWIRSKDICKRCYDKRKCTICAAMPEGDTRLCNACQLVCKQIAMVHASEPRGEMTPETERLYQELVAKEMPLVGGERKLTARDHGRSIAFNPLTVPRSKFNGELIRIGGRVFKKLTME